MNKIFPVTVAALTLFSTSSQAAMPGFFVGVQAGAGSINTKDYKRVVDADYAGRRSDLGSGETLTAAYNNANEKGFSGRLFAGYNFSEYFGLELGYSEYAKNSYNMLVTHQETGNNYTDYIIDSSFKTGAVDITGKAYLPLKTFAPALAPINLYAKLGMAYVIQKVNVGSYVLHRYNDGSRSIEDPDFQSMTNRKWQPTYGVGVAYAMTEQVSLDASWTRISGSGGSIGTGNFNGFTAETNLFALGIVYRFN